MTKERDETPESNPFLGGFGVYQGGDGGGAGRGFADDGRELLILAAYAVQNQEGHKLTDSQEEAVAAAVTDVVVKKNKFPTTREFFAGVCSAVSKVCEKLGLKKAASWFKDLSDAVMQRVSVKDIRAARVAGQEAVQGTSVSVTTAKSDRSSGQQGRSV